MPNERRLRANSIGGLIEDNPLTAAATTLTSAALATLPVVDTTNHCAIVLDPDGVEGAPEIVYVTAHAASATVATILRAQEGTTALQHSQDIPWVHAPTIKDYDGASGGSGLIALTHYRPVANVSTGPTTTAHADVDATNLIVTFTAPPSGRVLVRLTANTNIIDVCESSWNLREGAADVANTASVVAYQSSTGQRIIKVHHPIYVAGLTPGVAYTYKWGYARLSGTGSANITYGGNHGSAIMEVMAVNL